MENKDEIYDLLKAKMLSTAEIAAIPIEDNGQPLVLLEPNAVLKTTQIEEAMKQYTGEDIFVRQTVAEMAGQAALKLAQRDLLLDVVYGYRHPSIQINNFKVLEAQMAAENPELNSDEVYELTSLYRAPIEIAGHPTGSSIDVQVWQSGALLDMGTKQREFIEDTLVHSPFVSPEAWRNRQLLRNVMVGCGFAPYDGEWWHFSYGDREWAACYWEPKAIYGPLDFSSI